MESFRCQSPRVLAALSGAGVGAQVGDVCVFPVPNGAEHCASWRAWAFPWTNWIQSFADQNAGGCWSLRD